MRVEDGEMIKISHLLFMDDTLVFYASFKIPMNYVRLLLMPLRLGLVAKGWGGHKEGTRFESQ